MKLLKKLFGLNRSKDSHVESKTGVIDIVSNSLENILSISALDLSFDIEVDEEGGIFVDFFGKDEDMLIAKEGKLLDAFQLYFKRVLQRQCPEDKVNVVMNCNGFREKVDQSLIDLADRLKEVAISKSKPVYFRSLGPRDRKIVHQYLSEDKRVQSHSIGEGIYKRVKISPVVDESLHNKGQRGSAEARQ